MLNPDWNEALKKALMARGIYHTGLTAHARIDPDSAKEIVEFGRVPTLEEAFRISHVLGCVPFFFAGPEFQNGAALDHLPVLGGPPLDNPGVLIPRLIKALMADLGEWGTLVGLLTSRVEMLAQRP